MTTGMMRIEINSTEQVGFTKLGKRDPCTGVWALDGSSLALPLSLHGAVCPKSPTVFRATCSLPLPLLDNSLGVWDSEIFSLRSPESASRAPTGLFPRVFLLGGTSHAGGTRVDLIGGLGVAVGEEGWWKWSLGVRIGVSTGMHVASPLTVQHKAGCKVKESEPAPPMLPCPDRTPGGLRLKN